MDRYKVVRKIGVGSYGSAYLVLNKSKPAEQYVLKKIKVEEASSKERAQSELEVKLLAQLDHPFVLSYVDHFMYKSHLCIITDFCEAGDLYTYLQGRKQPVAEQQIHEWLVQIVLAVQHVHSRSVLHRDLKTQNIFLTKDGNVKLGDFGIARTLNGTVEFASTLVGTPYYMSPEIMQCQPYDYKSDLWSLGCVLYEMMSLKHAFDADDISSLSAKILRGEHLPMPTTYSKELQDLVTSLLSRNPKSRPTPEQMLGMPLLTYATRLVRGKLACMAATQVSKQVPAQSAQSGRRSGSTLSYFAVSASLEPCSVSGGGSDDSSRLNRELRVAKERLRDIEVERGAVREQTLQWNAEAPGGFQRRSSSQLPSSGPSRRPASFNGTAAVSRTARHSATQLSSCETSPPGTFRAKQRLSGSQVAVMDGIWGSGADDQCHTGPQHLSQGAQLQQQCPSFAQPWLLLQQQQQQQQQQHQQQEAVAGLEQHSSSMLLPVGINPIAAIEHMLRQDLPPVRGTMDDGASNSTVEAVRARRDTARAAELKRRDAQLLEARISYHEELRTAEVHASAVFGGSAEESTCGSAAGAIAVGRPPLARGTRSGLVGPSRRESRSTPQGAKPPAGHASSADLGASTSGCSGRPAMPPMPVRRQSSLSAPCSGRGFTNTGSAQLEDGEDDDVDTVLARLAAQRRAARGPAAKCADVTTSCSGATSTAALQHNDHGAQMELEEELTRGLFLSTRATGGHSDTNATGAKATLSIREAAPAAERAAALAALCSARLGPPLVRLIREHVSARGSATAASAKRDDAAFREELRQRLGIDGMWCVQLVEMCMLLEEQAVRDC